MGCFSPLKCDVRFFPSIGNTQNKMVGVCTAIYFWRRGQCASRCSRQTLWTLGRRIVFGVSCNFPRKRNADRKTRAPEKIKSRNSHQHAWTPSCIIGCGWRHVRLHRPGSICFRDLAFFARARKHVSNNMRFGGLARIVNCLLVRPEKARLPARKGAKLRFATAKFSKAISYFISYGRSGLRLGFAGRPHPVLSRR